MLLASKPYNGVIPDISPDLRWVSVPSMDEPVVYLWRRPEGKPLQTLSHDALLERLRALTCFRVAPDRTSPTGYRLVGAPFAGWEKVPTW